MKREIEAEVKDGRAGLWMGQLSALGGTGGLVQRLREQNVVAGGDSGRGGAGRGGAAHAGRCVQITAEGVWTLMYTAAGCCCTSVAYGTLHLEASVWSQVRYFIFAVSNFIIYPSRHHYCYQLFVNSMSESVAMCLQVSGGQCGTVSWS